MLVMLVRTLSTRLSVVTGDKTVGGCSIVTTSLSHIYSLQLRILLLRTCVTPICNLGIKLICIGSGLCLLGYARV